ncbi:MAG: hypothetical protein ACYDB9_12725 [Gammaproteobacteria bacterium]
MKTGLLPETLPLLLPRPLVNQLLHQAQTTTSFARGFILGRPGSSLRCQPLPAGTDLESAISALRGHPTPPFAFYRSSSAAVQAPAAQDARLLTGITAFYFGIFLETKGVLQLRGWRLKGEQMQAVDINITETG